MLGKKTHDEVAWRAPNRAHSSKPSYPVARVLDAAILIVVFALNAVAMAGPQPGTSFADRRLRPVTISDSINMTRMGLSTNVFDGAMAAGRVAHFSPDGKKFIIVVRKGNLGENTTDYSVLLWHTDIVSPPSRPVVVLTMRSSSPRPAIQGTQWLADNQTVAFLGENPGELQQLYTLNTRTGAIRKLTNHATNLISYTLTANGEQFAFAAEPPREKYFDEETRRRGLLISNQLITTLITGIKSEGRFQGEAQIFVKTRGRSLRRLKVPGRVPVWRETPFLAPTGRYIIMASRPSRIPKSWQDYTDPVIKQFANKRLRQGEYSLLNRYIIVDLRTGHAHVLLDSPLVTTGAWTEIAWAPDGRSVALGGLYLPLENTSGAERELRKTKPFIVEVKVPSGTFNEISHADVKLLGWDVASRELLLAPGKLDEKTLSPNVLHFVKQGDRWEQAASASESDSRPEVVMEEDMNTPPRIYAYDFANHRRRLLLDLNPQFDFLQFGRVEEIEWTGTDGTRVRGGLYYPIHYARGTRYPLVIQTHGWNHAQFWIDGPFTSAFAAQALAGKDIMVLQAEKPVEKLDKWWASIQQTPAETQTHMAIYEGAIEYLDKKGLIDRGRVGIIGFSRTCYYVKYALTHSRFHFKAASVTDGVDGGYFQYIAVSNTYSQISEGINGGLPFGQGLKAWMERSPGFNIDRVNAPIRIVALDHTLSLVSEWEWFSALHRLNKPVEMVAIEQDDHVLQRPWNQMISQDGNVDWFDFWLNGHEDPDPKKAEQYVRWRELRHPTSLKDGPVPTS